MIFMKEFLKDFCDLFASSLITICFMLASFLLLINLYHYKEVNYVYNVDMRTNINYVAFKDNVKKIETKLSSVNTSNLYGNKRSAANNIKGIINTCMDTLKNSDFYKLDEKNAITQKDIYYLNLDLNEELNDSCLFYLGYSTNHVLKTYNMQGSFTSAYNFINDQKIQIGASVDYLNDRLLDNSTYHYVTDITRNSIFNETSANLSYTINNYLELVSTVDNMTNWYVNEFGGAY